MVKRQQHRFISQDSDSRCCLDSERTGEGLLSPLFSYAKLLPFTRLGYESSLANHLRGVTRR
jgi:hypothetical protein